MANFPITTTIWIKRTLADQPAEIKITAATNQESLEIARVIYDALEREGVFMLSSRP